MIKHEGIIDHIEGDVAHVRIQSESACAACHAKGVCGAADQREKFLDIPVRGEEYRDGERVEVQVARNLGFKAVGFGYFYPFLLVMGVLIGLSTAGMNEMQAGCWALASVVPYYLLLYLFRQQIGAGFSFSIKKQP